MPNLTLLPGSLPAGYCYPSSPQTFYNDMFERAVAIQPVSLTGVLLQEAEPSVEQRGFIWARLIAGAPVNPFMWLWVNGAWVAKHPIPVIDERRWLYTGVAGSIDTLDGGAVAAVSDTTGPFWEIDTTYEARFPLGVGTLPLSTVSVIVGALGGADEITLTPEQLAAHTHPVYPSGRDNDWRHWGPRFDDGTTDQPAWPGTTGANVSHVFAQNQEGTTDEPHSNMPPYVGTYFLKRTGRIYCTAPIS